MDVSLLRFLERRVRFIHDTADKSYAVLGINWATSEILISINDRPEWADPEKLTLLPED